MELREGGITFIKWTTGPLAVTEQSEGYEREVTEWNERHEQGRARNAALTKFQERSSAEAPIIGRVPGMGYFSGKPDPVHNMNERA